MKQTTIEAKNSWKLRSLKELYEFRWVFFMFVFRDIKLRYKQTILGVTWVVLQPLLTAGLFAFVFGKIFSSQIEKIPYLLFAFCGLLPWHVFSQSLQRASTSLTQDTRLITKVYFPRMILPLSATFGVIIDFLIIFLLFLGLMQFYDLSLSTKTFYLPLCILVLFSFSSAINLLFSSAQVYFRDVKHMVPFLLQFWLYASPLAYSSSIVPKKFFFLYSINPMVGLIDAFRWSLLNLEDFPFISFSIALGVSFITLGISIWLFHKLEPYFADKV